MAEPISLTEGKHYRPIHAYPNLCRYLLNKAGSISTPLRIAESTIQGAGSGLFVKADVAEGQELFRSDPLIVVAGSSIEGLCDVCFLNNWSNCHEDGRFYKQDEKRVTIAKCNGCKVAKYCSKACQKKGWKMYHKLECAILQQQPDLPALDLALMRILNGFKLGALEPEAITALRALETHRDMHTKSDTENHEGPPSYYLSAVDAKIQTQSTCDLDLVHELYCMLQTNSFAIMAAEKEATLGTCFDYIVSLINHSCNENAHVFFEGNELRVRTLRSLKAGDEIFVCYTDPRADVLSRRDDLKNNFFIECNCPKCKNEIKDHLKCIGTRKKPLQHLKKCQKKLKDLEISTTSAYWKLNPRMVQLIHKLEEDVHAIKKKAFAGGKWPVHVEPMPSCMRSLGAMYHDMRNAVALKFYLSGTLYAGRKHFGQLWVLDLFDVVRCLIRMVQHPDGSPIWKVQGFLDRQELRDVARGYLQHLCVAAKKAFGLDTKFASSLHKFADALLEYPGDPGVATPAFIQQYQTSQSRMLDWAGIEGASAVALPDKGDGDTLTYDIKALTST